MEICYMPCLDYLPMPTSCFLPQQDTKDRIVDICLYHCSNLVALNKYHVSEFYDKFAFFPFYFVYFTLKNKDSLLIPCCPGTH